MNYDRYFNKALNALHEEGRYRVFTDLARQVGRFPKALDYSHNPPREITVWCSNDYLGMGQNLGLGQVGSGCGNGLEPLLSCRAISKFASQVGKSAVDMLRGASAFKNIEQPNSTDLKM